MGLCLYIIFPSVFQVQWKASSHQTRTRISFRPTREEKHPHLPAEVAGDQAEAKIEAGEKSEGRIEALTEVLTKTQT